MPPLILVVEDDTDTLAVIVGFLAAEGYRAMAAEDGVEALAAARRERPDVIVLDLMMPRMNALQFRNEQLRDPALKDIPIVCLSGLSHAQTAALELGISECLPKPVDLDRLLGAVRGAIAPRPARGPA
jgi:two-component system alkaline phosphatase synthesis response regulator PhoP